ncbi:MAG: alkaline phosphatase family protein [Candidatus Hydrothermarchaeaceae archaeon]
MQPKLLIVGLDGATFDVIDAHKSELPVLRKCMEDGVRGILESTKPPVTSPAWPCFMTGKNQGKIGVFDFLKLDRENGEIGVTTSRDIKSDTLWDIAGRNGKRVCVFEIPVTFPPSNVNGVMVSGYPSPDLEKSFYPPETLQLLRDEIGDFKDTFPATYKEGKEMEVYEKYRNVLKNRRDAILTLLDRDFDLMVLDINHTDIISHMFWHTFDSSHPRHARAVKRGIGNLVLEAYKDVDRVLGQMLSAVGDDVNVIIMSDHGQGKLSKMVNLNNLLMERGYLKFKGDVKTRLRRFLFMHGMNPEFAYSIIKKIGLQDFTEKFGREKRNRVLDKFLSFSDIDWSETKAYSFGYAGQIYITGDGSDYEKVREDLIADLRALKDERGRELVDEILCREDIYSGKYTENAPDLVLKMRNYEYISYPLLSSGSRFIVDPIMGYSGGHRLEGIFVAFGPDIKKGSEIAGAKITDIAPTALHLMGLPVPGDMDGRVLDEIIN